MDMFKDSRFLLIYLIVCVNNVLTQVIKKPTGITGTCGAEVSGLSSGYIASPGYPDNNYPNNVKCIYEIVAKANQVIGYRSVFLSLEREDENTTACYDHVTIYRSQRTNPDVFCGDGIIASDVTFGSRLLVEFFSDESISSEGFVLHWQVIDTTQLPPSLNCDFDGYYPLCDGWRQFQSDGFDWTFTRGKTPSNDTGPLADHTTGRMNDGRYAHIEASGVTRGSTAVLLSPTLYSDEEYCLEFWYNMLGDGFPQLNIIQMTARNEGNILQRITDVNHGNWTLFQYTIDPIFRNISIAFEAVRGSNFRSDLAIDDVTFTRGVCVAVGTDGLCMADEFQCSNPDDGCISKLFRCDGTRDCLDGSDEEGCATLPSECPSNLIYSTCAPSCNRTCEDGLAGRLCQERCVAGCTCPLDLPILNNNTCIDHGQCPSNGPKYREQAIKGVQERFARLFHHITNWITSQKT